jgi:hypothetical protein
VNVLGRLVVSSLAMGLVSCGGCSDGEKMSKEGVRVWGREKIAAEMLERAKNPIDAYLVGERPDLLQRVLNMRYEEAVARMGFIAYDGTARFTLVRNKHQLDLVEKTHIEHGLHGSFRVLQKDKDDAIARELVYNGGVMYVRNGPGKMRVQGLVEHRHLEMLDEAWQPLRVYTSYFGPRVGLRKEGAATVKGRGAAKYAFELRDGSEYVEVPGMKGKKKPVSLSGSLFIDEKTGVPIQVKLRGELEIPPAKADQKVGRLKLALDYTIETIEGAEVKPKDFVPTIKHRPVDLDPLAFLDGGTRTSTVIGGKKDGAKSEE